MSEQEYVLGTHSAEMDRLFRQHALWRAECQRVWAASGVRAGSRVLDIGCGPGAAAVDLAQIAGASGRVVGIEVSEKYALHARSELARSGCPHDIHVMDLMTQALPREMHAQFEITWSRWVSMFVAHPERIVEVARDALVAGGRAIFHEYVNYETYALHPSGPGVRRYVAAAVASFATGGGDVNVGRRLPTMLAERGFKIESLRVIASAVRPGEPLWAWPAAFIRTYASSLVERGFLQRADADLALAELNTAESDAALGGRGCYMVPPTLIEIVAVRE